MATKAYRLDLLPCALTGVLRGLALPDPDQGRMHNLHVLHLQTA